MKLSGTRHEALFHSSLSAVVEPITACTQGGLVTCRCHGKLSPGAPASLTPVPICPHCLQLFHCLGTGLRRGRGAGLGFQRIALGLWPPQIAPAICTTEQDAAHCGPKGTGLSSSSHLHCPLPCLADANGLWGRLPPDSGMPAVHFPGFLRSDKHSSSKTQSCVSTEAAGVWTPAPVLDPALLGSWCNCREDKGR